MTQQLVTRKSLPEGMSMREASLDFGFGISDGVRYTERLLKNLEERTSILTFGALWSQPMTNCCDQRCSSY